MRSPTQRSLELLRSQGFVPYVVESYNAFARIRKDLYGFIDIVALHPGRTGLLGVQTTTGTNLSARITKAEGLKEYGLWIACGNSVEFHGWRKILIEGKKRWAPIVRRVDMDELMGGK